MAAEDKLNKLLANGTGMKVPDGYFQNVMQQVNAKLPEHPSLKSENVETPRKMFWIKARPILYMAAMFAGIWCMMKVFTTIQTSPQVSIDNMPGMVAEALQNPDNLREVIIGNESDDMELSDDILENYAGDFEEFEADFNKIEN